MATLTAGQNLSWFRGFIQGKTRITLAWAFAILLGFSAREYPTWPGILICLMGASLRFWASGYLRKDSRPAVGGPYAYVRNPLYLGTYIMAVGTAFAIENVPLLAIVSVLFAGIYHFIILDEEMKLRRIFREPYSEYCDCVPRFIPKLSSLFSPANGQLLRRINPELVYHHFSLPLAIENKAYEAYASFVGIIGFVVAVAYFWKHFT